MLELLVLALLQNSSEMFGEWGPHNPTTKEIIERYQPATIPTKDKQKIAPKLLDDPYLSVIAQDLGSGKILFSKNSQTTQEIASISKIMTFLVIRDEHRLDEIAEVPLKATKVAGVKGGFYAYERVSVETLLQALLIPSANDAAVTLAVFNAETEEAFAKKMNKKARALKLKSAQFHNASGLDIYQPGNRCESEPAPNCTPVEPKLYGNKMSAKDVLTMTRIALQDKFFRTTVQKDLFEGTSANGEFFHTLKSTNQLLGTFVNSKGVKTGYTQLAGQCLVNLSEDENGQRNYHRYTRFF